MSERLEKIAAGACEDCRIEISTDGIAVDSSTGNLYLEAGIFNDSNSSFIHWTRN